jgi:uncharacterized membrane protein
MIGTLRVSNVIRVDAHAEVVWAMTVDIERWPEWVPTVTAVTRLDNGPLKRGSVARLEQPMQPPVLWVVTVLESERRFAWESRRRGLRFVATHDLLTDASATMNTLTVEASGVMAVLLWPLLRIALSRALAAENQALKQRCEALRPRGPLTSAR